MASIVVGDSDELADFVGRVRRMLAAPGVMQTSGPQKTRGGNSRRHRATPIPNLCRTLSFAGPGCRR